MALGEQELPLHNLWSHLWTHPHMPQTSGPAGPESRHPCTQRVVSVLLTCETTVGTCTNVAQAAQPELQMHAEGTQVRPEHGFDMATSKIQVSTTYKTFLAEPTPDYVQQSYEHGQSMRRI